MTQPSRTPTQITDPSGLTVASNVRRVREARGWSTYELAKKLKDGGRPVSPSALAKIERGERRVDVGDLMALAVALNVPPSGLLLPVATEPTAEVEITGRRQTVFAIQAWEWADGRGTLDVPAGGHEAYQAHTLYRLYGRPHWLVDLEDEEEAGADRNRGSRLARVAGIERDEVTGRYRFRREGGGDDG
ncbi:helix-turn-helix transcriptional regulator [Streptomyces sp. J2-1]|uniref:helix-turn-helix domain-containing protein n=1 Tax=Streptomyces corallincola TaxID=2851888 RepID=UPI001C38AA7B|nr:helix-turn-helix transcriptional regulator [Streptomyces corallincola]MBV2357810.1 helix-turn-helix transcriptional regulator [Streptomyces corallincola]